MGGGHLRVRENMLSPFLFLVLPHSYSLCRVEGIFFSHFSIDRFCDEQSEERPKEWLTYKKSTPCFHPHVKTSGISGHIINLTLLIYNNPQDNQRSRLCADVQYRGPNQWPIKWMYISKLFNKRMLWPQLQSLPAFKTLPAFLFCESLQGKNSADRYVESIRLSRISQLGICDIPHSTN